MSTAAWSPASSAWYASRASVDVGPGGQPRQHPGVEIRPLHRRDRLLDRHPGQLVPEPDAAAVGVQDAGPRAFVQPAAVGPAGGPHESHLGPVGNHRRDVKRRAGVRTQAGHPRQHGVAHARRDRLVRGRQDLGDEERVAAGDRVQAVGVQAVRLREVGHRGRGQRRHRHAPHRPSGGEVAEDDAQRMVAIHLVVAERRDDDRVGVGDPTAEEQQEIQGGLVGPVHVLEHGHRRRAAGQQVEERGEDGVPGRVRGHQPGQFAARAAGDVPQWTQRTGRAQRFAGALEDAGRGRRRIGEPARSCRCPPRR